MGVKIFPGRFTIENDGDFTVFLIGMRINKLTAIHKWLPVVMAMPPMIQELYTNKEIGCLGMENFANIRTVLMVQYWRSEKELLNYARSDKHLKAWSNFNKKVGNNKAVGIYHETYNITNNNFEAYYGNMPKFGLGKAMTHVEVTKNTNSAKDRLRK